MHYRNGQEVKPGDMALSTESFSPTSGTQIVGIVTTGNPGSTTCNGRIWTVAIRHNSSLGWGPWVPLMGGPSNWTVTFSNCDKIDGLPEPVTVATEVDTENKQAAVPA
jgi:hypothetical protein